MLHERDAYNPAVGVRCRPGTHHAAPLEGAMKKVLKGLLILGWIPTLAFVAMD